MKPLQEQSSRTRREPRLYAVALAACGAARPNERTARRAPFAVASAELRLAAFPSPIFDLKNAVGKADLCNRVTLSARVICTAPAPSPLYRRWGRAP